MVHLCCVLYVVCFVCVCVCVCVCIEGDLTDWSGGCMPTYRRHTITIVNDYDALIVHPEYDALVSVRKPRAPNPQVVHPHHENQTETEGVVGRMQDAVLRD